MTTTWPATLPTGFLLGHSDAPQPQVAAFHPITGAAALYQTGDARTRVFEGRLRLSDAQRETFLVFFRDLRRGAGRFEITTSGLDDQTWLCQFAAESPYSLEGAGAGWWLGVSLVLVRRLL